PLARSQACPASSELPAAPAKVYPSRVIPPALSEGSRLRRGSLEMDERQTANVWRPTACNLCYVNCGIEVVTEGRRIVKIRGDKAHPDTKGYACQKALRLDYYQNQADRLTSPLRRRANGTFEPIT